MNNDSVAFFSMSLWFTLMAISFAVKQEKLEFFVATILSIVSLIVALVIIKK